MIIVDILLALAVALLLTGIFAYGFCELRGGDQLLFFFSVLFLATWAGGVWITQYGPLIHGVAWLSFMAVGFTIALLLANLMASGKNPCRTMAERSNLPEGQVSRSLFGIFFWLLTIVLIVAIVLAYLFPA
jgi:hypothetical protein